MTRKRLVGVCVPRTQRSSCDSLSIPGLRHPVLLDHSRFSTPLSDGVAPLQQNVPLRVSIATGSARTTGAPLEVADKRLEPRHRPPAGVSLNPCDDETQRTTGDRRQFHPKAPSFLYSRSIPASRTARTSRVDSGVVDREIARTDDLRHERMRFGKLLLWENRCSFPEMSRVFHDGNTSRHYRHRAVLIKGDARDHIPRIWFLSAFDCRAMFATRSRRRRWLSRAGSCLRPAYRSALYRMNDHDTP